MTKNPSTSAITGSTSCAYVLKKGVAVVLVLFMGLCRVGYAQQDSTLRIITYPRANPPTTEYPPVIRSAVINLMETVPFELQAELQKVRLDSVKFLDRIDAIAKEEVLDYDRLTGVELSKWQKQEANAVLISKMTFYIDRLDIYAKVVLMNSEIVSEHNEQIGIRDVINPDTISTKIDSLAKSIASDLEAKCIDCLIIINSGRDRILPVYVAAGILVSSIIGYVIKDNALDKALTSYSQETIGTRVAEARADVSSKEEQRDNWGSAVLFSGLFLGMMTVYEFWLDDLLRNPERKLKISPVWSPNSGKGVQFTIKL